MPGRKFACWRTCTPPRNDSAADTSPANVLGHRLFREEAERIQVDSFWSYRVLRLRCKNKQVRRAYCRRAECLAFHLHRICLAKSGPQLGGNGAFGGQTAFSLPLVTKQIRTFAGIDSPHFLLRCFVSSSALLAKESYANRCRLAAVPFRDEGDQYGFLPRLHCRAVGGSVSSAENLAGLGAKCPTNTVISCEPIARDFSIIRVDGSR